MNVYKHKNEKANNINAMKEVLDVAKKIMDTVSWVDSFDERMCVSFQSQKLERFNGMGRKAGLLRGNIEGDV